MELIEKGLEDVQLFNFIVVVFFVFGACVGSFLNVCILRIPKGESIVSPPSHCKCGKTLSWRENIPILGWLFLRGKAKCCGSKISPRYFFIELLMACIFATLSYMVDVSGYMSISQAIFGAIFLSLLVVISFIDIDTLHLPDFLTIGGTFLGLILCTFIQPLGYLNYSKLPYFIFCIDGFVVSALGIIVGTGVLYWIRLIAEVIFRREAMGEGDVILVAMIGAFCGWQGAIFSIFGGSVLGMIILLPILFFKKFQKDEQGGTMVPFGPFLCLGGAVYWLWKIYILSYMSGAIQNFILLVTSYQNS